MLEAAVETALESLARDGIDAWVFIDDQWYITNPGGEYVPLERRTVGYDAVVVERFEDIDLSSVEKIVASTKDAALLQRMDDRSLAIAAGALRHDGLARVVDGAVAGVSALSAPVFDASGALVLSLTAIGPTASFDTTAQGVPARALCECAAALCDVLGASSRKAGARLQ